MAISAQETAMFVDIDGQVTKVGCPTSISGAGTTNEQIETTCLGSTARNYQKGLATPGELSFDIRFDPNDASHIALKELHKAGTTTEWAIGFSDGDSEPTNLDGMTFTARSGIVFSGFMTSFEFSFEMSDVIGASIGVQISGQPTVTAKAA
jgi:hypothetical protein